MPRLLRRVSPFAVLMGALAAQAALADPPHLPPTLAPRGAVDTETGALFTMGGRPDNVLDVWRLHAGVWQRHAAGPFQGTVFGVAYDPVRDRLVASVADGNGVPTLQELDGTTWVAGPTLPVAGAQLLWHPVRTQLLVWMRPPFANSHTLWSWDGAALVQLPTVGLGLFASLGDRIGYDSARNRLVVPQTAYAVSVPWVHEWDGTTWTTVVAPPGSSGGSHVLTDPQTGRAVFASTTSSQPSVAWTGQAFVAWPMPGVPPRADALLVGNPVRSVCQLVGGAETIYVPHADTWEFAGASWQQATPDVGDPVFGTPAMVGIGAKTALVFDGGPGGIPGGPARTAIWNDGTWTELQPAHSPSPRYQFALAGDPATGRAFLFGGAAGQTLLADFWMWNGTDWQQLPGGPPARMDHGLCFRADAQRVVLYGGRDAAGAANYETWEWDGAAWSLRNATFPPHSGPARLTWQPLRQRTVLTTFGLLGIEMWEWNGVSWFSTSPPTRPAVAPVDLQVAYDPVRETIIVVEPMPLPSLGGMHEWDGGAWRSFAPDPRLRCSRLAVAGVPGFGLAVMNLTGRLTLHLEHDFPARVLPFGAACPDPQRNLTATQPWLGESYTLRYPCAPGTACLFASGFSNVQWNGVALPFGLASLGLPSCALLVAADVLDVRLPANGEAQLAIALPPTPALAGMRLYHQAAALAPGLTAVSQGLEIVTGALW